MRWSVLEPVVLTDDGRKLPERWARRPTSAQAPALRCRIVLACAGGDHNAEAAGQIRVSRATVGKWRGRFLEVRLE